MRAAKEFELSDQKAEFFALQHLARFLSLSWDAAVGDFCRRAPNPRALCTCQLHWARKKSAAREANFIHHAPEAE